ncbi:uncharacterized protein ARB_03597 [Trichophyton benhamiae CBS 112371]|uniref:Uncharacterized protein n=1 Tax=Arthroderma benhamiae (strain ATCC MYA-4681 / CBS 112371) TaxID=663331 RepID=D4B571_ARTBC|nr:uncharacterized protein ARB_03597 [Trichophyton benhamiae CBS 112371]EFE29519.1 hypothetical protein ARB_03597 [Trichophyton benhamiae CBS 112371]
MRQGHVYICRWMEMGPFSTHPDTPGQADRQTKQTSIEQASRDLSNQPTNRPSVSQSVHLLRRQSKREKEGVVKRASSALAGLLHHLEYPPSSNRRSKQVLTLSRLNQRRKRPPGDAHNLPSSKFQLGRRAKKQDSQPTRRISRFISPTDAPCPWGLLAGEDGYQRVTNKQPSIESTDAESCIVSSM